MREDIEDSRELAGWMAFLEMEPPQAESWNQAAMLALNARRLAGDRRAKLKDFLPTPPRTVESAQGLVAKMRSIFPGAAPGIKGDDDDVDGDD